MRRTSMFREFLMPLSIDSTSRPSSSSLSLLLAMLKITDAHAHLISCDDVAFSTDAISLITPHLLASLLFPWWLATRLHRAQAASRWHVASPPLHTLMSSGIAPPLPILLLTAGLRMEHSDRQPHALARRAVFWPTVRLASVAHSSVRRRMRVRTERAVAYEVFSSSDESMQSVHIAPAACEAAGMLLPHRTCCMRDGAWPPAIAFLHSTSPHRLDRAAHATCWMRPLYAPWELSRRRMSACTAPACPAISLF
mmetsp:Transcript_21144/g.51335  ORF Transcript_21144/g.51335 Transcript_21144/m.51335 type:complete len:253 (-) Transcript_21144:57-815(-)